MKSILIIGGGLVGVSCALRLQAAGLAVTLIDPGDKKRGASYGNAVVGVGQCAARAAFKLRRGRAARFPLD